MDERSPPDLGTGPSPSLATRAYERLRDAIEAGQLKPKARLREEALAEWLAMSRTPVREAVRRLEAEGLFSREARALVVASLDQQGVAELYAMREVLEGTAAAFAARQGSDVEHTALHELHDLGASLLDRPQDLVRHNERFHSALYGAAHNRYLLKTLGALRDARALLGMSTLADPDRARAASSCSTSRPRRSTRSPRAASRS
jgi:DNA-binding GntR family transcriptional regulator